MLKLTLEAVRLHTVMLNDRARTSSFIESIHEVVRRGDVVVDIGTGTGVLAVAAAQAGARHVYAIEEGSIGKVAQEVFAANDLADRITLLHGRSTEVDLPERADVLVSELIGNEPLGEKILEAVSDAAKRFLKRRARLIPGGLKIFGLPVTVPESERRNHIFTPKTLQDWKAWYGIEFSPLATVNRNTLLRSLINSYTLRGWRALSAPILLAEINLKRCPQGAVESTRTATASASGELSGLVVYFELTLTPTRHFSTHPAAVDKTNHWLSPVWLFTDTLSLNSGDQFYIIYRYDGVTGWVQCEVGTK
jgi:type I protein arginine methyltransferase